MDTKNRGVIVKDRSAADYIYGLGQVAQTNIPMSIRLGLLPENELQKNALVDFMNCVTFGGKHCLEMWMNFLLPSISDEFRNFLYENSYVQNGKVKFSARFSSLLNYTTMYGNDQGTVSNQFRRDGLLPDSMLPMGPEMTWNDYYDHTKITPEMMAIAKQLLSFITIQYQVVDSHNFDKALDVAPISVATEICAGWDSGAPVNRCSGQPLQHDTMVWGREAPTGTYDDFDDYPPFKQQLAKDYEFPVNTQYIVALRPLMLRVKMRGENVAKLQHDLNSLGARLSTDGNFGPKTEQAVKDFQHAYGLDPDGIAGPKTLQRINVILILNRVAIETGVPVPLMIEVCRAESGFDPNCINKNSDKIHSTDRGLFQYNDLYHKEISDAVAFDPELSARQAAKDILNKKLHDYWSASEPNWGKRVDPSIVQKYY